MTDRSYGWLSGHGRSWKRVPSRDPFVSQAALQRDFNCLGAIDGAIRVQQSSIPLLRRRFPFGTPVLRASGRIPNPAFLSGAVLIELTHEREDCRFTVVALQGGDTIRVRVPSGLSAHKVDLREVGDRPSKEIGGRTTTPTLKFQGQDVEWRGFRGQMR